MEKSIQERELDMQKQAVKEGTLDAQYLPDDGNNNQVIKMPVKKAEPTALKEEVTPVVEEPVIEKIVEETPVEATKESTEVDAAKEEVREFDFDKAEKEVKEEPVLEVVKEEPTPVVEPTPELKLPENIDKLVKFMDETGGTLVDYVELNKDYSKLEDNDLVKAYYKSQNPEMDSEEINFLIEDDFPTDSDFVDEDSREYKRSQLKLKRTLKEAKRYFDNRKETYFADLKSSNAGTLNSDAQDAMKFRKEFDTQQENNQKLHEHFQNETNKVFSDDFKGFDFKTEGGTFRYNVNDITKTKSVQSDISNIVGEFLDDKGLVKDAASYHKAMFAARNVDKLANHFYQQGLADAIRQREMDTKNIDMTPKSTSAPAEKLSEGMRYIKDGNDGGQKINWPGRKTQF